MQSRHHWHKPKFGVRECCIGGQNGGRFVIWRRPIGWHSNGRGRWWWASADGRCRDGWRRPDHGGESRNPRRCQRGRKREFRWCGAWEWRRIRQQFHRSRWCINYCSGRDWSRHSVWRCSRGGWRGVHWRCHNRRHLHHCHRDGRRQHGWRGDRGSGNGRCSNGRCSNGRCSNGRQCGCGRGGWPCGTDPLPRRSVRLRAERHLRLPLRNEQRKLPCRLHIELYVRARMR
jgi:hypothetical protein